MNKKCAAVVAMAMCPVLFLSSCVHHYPVYGSASVGYADGGVGVGVSAAWTPASYDANGFPIYGYSYGRPVYGYTPDGVAIFTFAALTAACLVPLWAPAPWYHGHWHYPHGCHRVSAPPHFPHDHAPAMRPHGGLNAPIHKNPHQVLHGSPKPSAIGHAPLREQHKAPQHREMQQPNRVSALHNNNREHHAAPQPVQQHHNAPQREQQHHAAPLRENNSAAPQRPQQPLQHHAAQRPQQHNAAAQPMQFNHAAPQRVQQHAAPQSMQFSRPAAAPQRVSAPAISRPAAPAGGAFQHASSHGGHSHGSMGGHRR